MIFCRTCKREVATTAKTCPHCGEKYLTVKSVQRLYGSLYIKILLLTSVLAAGALSDLATIIRLVLGTVSLLSGSLAAATLQRAVTGIHEDDDYQPLDELEPTQVAVSMAPYVIATIVACAVLIAGIFGVLVR